MIKLNEEQKLKLEERLHNQQRLSPSLFGDNYDLYDFDEESYKFFIDNVESIGELIRGLDSISPFADDALAIAKKMTREDFDKFKRHLNLRPRWEGSVVLKRTEIDKMPEKYLPIILPKLFCDVDYSLKEKYGISLGTYLIQTIRAQNEN
jgi:hypothetical protein